MALTDLQWRIICFVLYSMEEQPEWIVIKMVEHLRPIKTVAPACIPFRFPEIYQLVFVNAVKTVGKFEPYRFGTI